jgi:hypothetical protein
MKNNGLTDSPANPSATANNNPNNRMYLSIDQVYGKEDVR